MSERSTIAGRAAFFQFGNTNSTATIDINGAYTGLSEYYMLLVGALAWFILYTGPLLHYVAAHAATLRPLARFDADFDPSAVATSDGDSLVVGDASSTARRLHNDGDSARELQTEAQLQSRSNSIVRFFFFFLRHVDNMFVSHHLRTGGSI
jgi:hypothetical protein